MRRLGQQLEEQQQWGDDQPARRPQIQEPIVTSGESDEGVLGGDHSDDDYGDDDDDRFVDSEDDGHEQKMNDHQDGDDDHYDAFYDQDADLQDEAYVYQVLRSGAADPPATRDDDTNTTSNSSHRNNMLHNSHNNKFHGTKTITKPRNSDAVLSCPCCLSIVCMDCQQHERYANQYRAMFVMNILVRWDLTLRYDLDTQQLVPTSTNTNNQNNNQNNNNNNNNHQNLSVSASKNGTTTPLIVEDDEQEQAAVAAATTTTTIQAMESQGNHDRHQVDSDIIYYTVCCAHCYTQVASLDMTDEVYHFYGCVASA